MAKWIAPRPDLGIRRLLPEWKALFGARDLRQDTVAGLTVACVAIPLSLAIALASGVPPAVGLVTAIVAGITCALFGGTPLQVSGPAAAMAVLVATLVQQHGLGAMAIIGATCGVLQLLTGALGLGRVIKLVPLPVIEGFTAGIGAIILVGQLPRALGLPPPEQSHVLDVLTHIADVLHQTRWPAVVVTLLTLGVIYGLPRITQRVPAQLAAVVVASIVVAALGLDVATIGEIPRSLPAPHLPALPGKDALLPIVTAALVVYALASLETLLSATAVDRLSKGKRSDPDQELIGQGIGNFASAVFGGIPVTGVIARSGVNVQAGARTRRSAIIHALALLATVLVAAPVMQRIPIAALAAVLFSIAARMLSPASLVRFWRHSRADGFVYLITFVVIVSVDLLEGVQWGVGAALVIAAVRLGKTHTLVRGARAGDQYVFVLEGPLTFLSSLHVDRLRGDLALLESGRTVVLDVRGVSTVDASGAEMLAEVVEHAGRLGLRAIVLGLPVEAHTRYVAAAGAEQAEATLANDEQELAEKVGGAIELRLQAGLQRYRAGMRPRYSRLFERLAEGQQPHTLFITCSDSRINPNLITATEPGELFIVRDIGNVVPPANAIPGASVSAAVEYAIGVLGVTKVVVCGHSGCGAIRALRSGEALPQHLSQLEAWLERTSVRALVRNLPAELPHDEVARLNVLAQIDHLKTYPLVADRIGAGELSVEGWFFDIAAGDVEVWSAAAGRFLTTGDDLDQATTTTASHPPAGTPQGTPQPAH